MTMSLITLLFQSYLKKPYISGHTIRMANNYHRIIIKIGSNVLTQSNGLPDVARISHLVDQVAAIKKQGKEVILVSSGAVASGRSLISIDERVNSVAARQLLASIGQVKLINTYAHLFELTRCCARKCW
jgi:glutamate 5-kinase